jgi:hypothetical protein
MIDCDCYLYKCLGRSFCYCRMNVYTKHVLFFDGARLVKKNQNMAGTDTNDC